MASESSLIPRPFAGNGLHNRRRPFVAANCERLHSANFPLDRSAPLMVHFIDDENVGDLHDPGFDGLHIVAHSRDENHDSDIGQANDIDFVLADADSFDQDEVAAGGIEHRGDVGGGPGQSAQRAARGHAANVNAGIGKMVLHANAVAENCAAGVGAGRIDGDDADGVLLLR